MAGPLALPPAKFADEFAQLRSDSPRLRGARFAIARLPAARLDDLAAHCATRLDGCDEVRPDIELARGNGPWLKAWLASAPSREAIPRLRQLRRFLPPPEAHGILETALAHSDKSVAAWAMSDLTAHLPKDDADRQAWGRRLLGLLDDPELGGAAALQLARMTPDDWLEAASAQPLGERGRGRLELMAELENALGQADSDRGAER